MLVRISDGMSTFTNSHRLVGEYILNSPDEVIYSTLEEVADRAGVSTTTVIRFARAVGCDGYSQLQRQIRKDVKELSIMPERLRTMQDGSEQNDMLTMSFQNDISNISLTLRSINRGQLDSAVDRISKAGRIYIVGMRESFALAHYMFGRLCSIRDDVRLVQAAGGMYADELSGAGRPDDMCIAFTFMRYTRHTITLLKELRRKGVFVLLFTNPNCFAVDDLADIILSCHVNGIGHRNSSAAPICLINYITNAVAAGCREDALLQLEEREDMLMRGGIFW